MIAYIYEGRVSPIRGAAVIAVEDGRAQQLVNFMLELRSYMH